MYIYIYISIYMYICIYRVRGYPTVLPVTQTNIAGRRLQRLQLDIVNYVGEPFLFVQGII